MAQDIEEIDEVDEEEDDEEGGDDMCDMCMCSGVNVGRTTYCGKTLGVECGCDDDSDGTCGDDDCEECEEGKAEEDE